MTDEYDYSPDDVNDDNPYTGESVPEEAPAALSETERLRPPRAQGFRRRLRNQISTLPLAISLLALAAYLVARAQDIDRLPDLTTGSLIGLVVLAVAFTAVFRALVFGRRDRGLLFLGLWVWITAGAAVLLVSVVDDEPDAETWWPLLLVALGLTFFVTYLVERAHDARLAVLSVLVLVASVAAFSVTGDYIDQDILNRVADYWPLLLSAAGVGLLPFVFRRTG